VRSRWIPIVGLSLAAAALLTGLVFIAVGEEGPLPPVDGADTVQRLYGGLDEDGAELGDPDAPVTIDIFNDLQCTDCADYHLETVPPLVEALVRPGDAKLVFRHRAIGQSVVTASAVGAGAAGLQDYEWPYAHLVFLNQDSIETTGATDQFLERVAQTIPAPEFDYARWKEDRESPEVEDQILSDDETAANLGLASPAVVVEGPSGSIELEDSPSVSEIEDAVAEVR
jgi:protein-disulfide isomerase